MTFEWNDEQLAAAATADRYIEILLSTKPEMLVSYITGVSFNDVAASAKQLTDFRQLLINQLSQQPLAAPEFD